MAGWAGLSFDFCIESGAVESENGGCVVYADDISASQSQNLLNVTGREVVHGRKSVKHGVQHIPEGGHGTLYRRYGRTI